MKKILVVEDFRANVLKAQFTSVFLETTQFDSAVLKLILFRNVHLQNLKQQLCKAHENIDNLEEEFQVVKSESRKNEEEIAKLKETLHEKVEEIERIKEQRNQLAKGECESQLAFDIMYNEAVEERKNAIER